MNGSHGIYSLTSLKESRLLGTSSQGHGRPWPRFGSNELLEAKKAAAGGRGELPAFAFVWIFLFNGYKVCIVFFFFNGL